MRIIDTLIVFRILKFLVTPFKQKAYAYNLRYRLDDYKPRTAVQVKGEIDKILGVSVYEGYVGDNRVLLSAEDVY